METGKGAVRLLFAVILALQPICAQAAENGQWVLAEDGRRWMYCYSPNRKAEDVWLEEDGKTYYLDAQGYMKTGWVTNQEDGKRYYMGTDGAMCSNTFASDGRYVGPDGSELPAYDTYRKAAKKVLEEEQKHLNGETGGFVLTDLNGDGYEDLIIAEAKENFYQPIRIAIWNSEEDFVDSALFEARTDLNQRFVYLPQNGIDAVLEISWPEGGVQVFQLDGMEFKCKWNLEVKPDRWGGVEYLSDGVKISRQDWEQERCMALAEKQENPVPDYLPLTETSIVETVDRILTPEETALW